MPILPPTGSLPYDSVANALILARTRLNDAMASTSGDILTNTQPFAQPIVNIAWRRLQSFLANLGYALFKSEVVLGSLPICASQDYSVQCYISWTQYFDGVSFYSTPHLPFDCIMPLYAWERQTGSTGGFNKMTMALDGLPDGPKYGYNCMWEWRENTMFFPGTVTPTDMRIRYAAYLPDFVNVGNVPWYNALIPCMRGMDALAWYIVHEFSLPRGDMDSATFLTLAESSARKVFNVEAQAKQRVTAQRRGFARSRHGSYETGI